jgi:thioredoxin-related protein
MTKLIKFTQEGCRPCTVLDGMLGILEVKPDQTVVIEDFENDENVKKFDIMSTPTLIAVDEDGTVVGRVSGVNPPQISALLNQIGRL